MTRARMLMAALCLSLIACRKERDPEAQAAPTYLHLQASLEERCAPCHNGARAEAGYVLTDPYAAIGCANGKVVIEPPDENAPLIRVLEREDHAEFVDAALRAELIAWVKGGARSEYRIMHEQGILDPRSDAWHGRLAATDGYAPLHDENHAFACGRCHDGSPVRPQEISRAVTGATACTSCHDGPQGVLACNTCHGQGTRAYPPRDACYFGGASRDPHAAHLTEPTVRADALACETCHAVPKDTLFGGTHADGKVDVVFRGELAEAGAHFDQDEGTCAVACHNRGGARATPTWESTEPLDCQSCHRSPPQGHYPGTCNGCHGNMGSDPESLLVDARHMNGQVDLGDGTGTCSACHGRTTDGLPDDAPHNQHRNTRLTLPIGCESCHRVPSHVMDEGHLNGTVEVTFSGRALSDGLVPTFDSEQRTCASVACHGAALTSEPRVVTWGEPSRGSAECIACHQTPPPPPHAQVTACGGGLCHGAEVAPNAGRYSITESGRALHIDGRVR